MMLRPMHSLRRQLLTWLLPLLVATALVTIVCQYFMFGVMTDFFMDNQLRVFADSHADSAVRTAALPQLTAHSVGKGDLIVQIWDRDGRLLTTSYADLALSRQATPGFHDVVVGDAGWRVYAVESSERIVQSAQSLTFREHLVRDHALQSGLPIALLIPICSIILWWAIRFALHRLELVARAAAMQDENTFGELPIEHAPAEIRPLVVAVNKLLARLCDALSAQRRFVQDAAHELRTPITAMSLQLENLKARVTDATTAEQVAQLDAGLARTKRLVDQLLRLARQEAPRNAQARVEVQLGEAIKDAITDFMPIADRRRIDLGFVASIGASVMANRDDLRSVLHNVLDNALRYTPEGGVVDVALHNDTGVVTVEIVDGGPGVPPEVLPRVFDRFFRIEGSGVEGSGLGLAIAKHAAERNEVELEVLNRTDRSGLIARLRFRNAAIEPEHAATQSAPVEWRQAMTTQAVDG